MLGIEVRVQDQIAIKNDLIKNLKKIPNCTEPIKIFVLTAIFRFKAQP